MLPTWGIPSAGRRWTHPGGGPVFLPAAGTFIDGVALLDGDVFIATGDGNGVVAVGGDGVLPAGVVVGPVFDNGSHALVVHDAVVAGDDRGTGVGVVAFRFPG